MRSLQTQNLSLRLLKLLPDKRERWQKTCFARYESILVVEGIILHSCWGQFIGGRREDLSWGSFSISDPVQMASPLRGLMNGSPLIRSCCACFKNFFSLAGFGSDMAKPHIQKLEKLAPGARIIATNLAWIVEFARWEHFNFCFLNQIWAWLNHALSG